MALGVLLFVLVWVREWTRMPGQIALALTVAIVAVWATAHVVLYGTFAKLADVLRPRSASVVAGSPPGARPSAIRLAALAGLILGIWLPYLFPLGPIGLMGFVVLITLFVYLLDFLLVRP